MAHLVVEDDAGLAHQHLGAERAPDGEAHGDGVAVAVQHPDMGGAALPAGGRHGLGAAPPRGQVHGDLVAKRGSALAGNERLRRLAEIRLARVLQKVRRARLGGFRDQMQISPRVVAELVGAIALHDAQHPRQGQPSQARRRRRDHRAVPVAADDRTAPHRLVAVEVVQGEGLDPCGKGLADGAIVEGAGPLPGDGLEGFRQLRLTDHLSHFTGLPGFLQKDAREIGTLPERRKVLLDGAAQPARCRKPLGGMAHGRRQHGFQRQAPEPLERLGEAGHGSRNRHGQVAGLQEFPADASPIPIELRGRRRRGDFREVEHMSLLLTSLVEHHHAAPAQTRRCRIHHRQGERGRHRGIHRVAALLQYPHARPDRGIMVRYHDAVETSLRQRKGQARKEKNAENRNGQEGPHASHSFHDPGSRHRETHACLFLCRSVCNSQSFRETRVVLTLSCFRAPPHPQRR